MATLFIVCLFDKINYLISFKILIQIYKRLVFIYFYKIIKLTSHRRIQELNEYVVVLKREDSRNFFSRQKFLTLRKISVFLYNESKKFFKIKCFKVIFYENK